MLLLIYTDDFGDVTIQSSFKTNKALGNRERYYASCISGYAK